MTDDRIPMQTLVDGMVSWFTDLQAAFRGVLNVMWPKPLVGQIRLTVHCVDGPSDRRWEWAVSDQHPDHILPLVWNREPTHAQALAIGLANLDELVMRQRRQREQA